ncbi:MAG TPA: hypothetical protein VJ508_00725, partial [Saprospiraceae bacterium]|nr:hypothetical protein [Saprospiraceae bacterium]
TTTATFTIEDTTSPSISPSASNQTVECDGSGNTAQLSAWLASHGGASATDICSGVTWSNDFTTLSDDCGATGSATVHFTATDACGNSSTTTATFTIEDTTPPTISPSASNQTVECDGSGNTAQLNAWLSSQGGASATDVCSGVTWSNDFTTLSDDCGATGSATVHFTATDACGNSSTTTATFTIEDTTGPSITCPPDITITYPASTDPSNTGSATAIDVCSGEPIVIPLDSISPNTCPDINFIKRFWHAIDACGNETICSQWITILDHGSICGTVTNDLGNPMSGVQLQLVKDLNGNQNADGGEPTVATTTSSAGTGAYCFNDVPPCQYVVVEVQPATYGSLSDKDDTPDPDGDDSSDGADNQIPVTLTPVENDLDNHFIDIICPTVLPTIPFDTICSGQSVTLQISDLNLGALTYSWNFGSGSSPGTGTGLGPITVSYVTTTQNQVNGASVVMTISKTGCPNLVGEVTRIDVNPYPNPAINTSTAPICYYTNKTFQPVAPLLTGATYQWNFGAGAVPATATGYGPHIVYYTSTGSKTAKLVIHPNEAGAQCPDSSTVTFT